MKRLGLYIHIPFCIEKCRYCDFLSFGGNDESLHLAYIEALIAEIENIKGCGYEADSIYIGGGTPSLLNSDSIIKMMDAVSKAFAVSDNAEISIEANPKTVTTQKLSAYHSAGINRLSMGAQSTDDGLLKVLGRVHNSSDITVNYEQARKAGFDNINIDLMFAIPGQTRKQWMNSLSDIINLGPEHISFYSLQLEEGTPFYRMFTEGTLEYIDDETDRNMYHDAIEKLNSSGYMHYEISNAAKPGYQCEHNLKYWSMDEYLGLGLGSHSYINGQRFSNERNLYKYIETGNKLIKKEKISMKQISGLSPFVVWEHKNSRQDDISEYIFTGLRKIEGIQLNDFTDRFGISVNEIYNNEILEHIENGLLELSEERLKFTLKGIDLSNFVLVDFV